MNLNYNIIYISYINNKLCSRIFVYTYTIWLWNVTNIRSLCFLIITQVFDTSDTRCRVICDFYTVLWQVIYRSNVCCIVDSYAVEFFIKFEYTMRRYKFVSINHSMHSTHRSFIHHALFLTTNAFIHIAVSHNSHKLL